MRRFRQLLGDLVGLADDEALAATDLRARLRGLIAPFEPERRNTQVAATRQELARKSHDLTRLLPAARAVHRQLVGRRSRKVKRCRSYAAAATMLISAQSSKALVRAARCSAAVMWSRRR